LANESQCGLHTAVAEFGHGRAGIGSACSVLSDGFARYECIILASAKHNVWESFVLAEGSAIDFPSLTPMFRATAGSYRLAAHSHKILICSNSGAVVGTGL
jgi:hypothetical protein